MASNFSSIASTILGLFARVASLSVLCTLAFEAVAAPYQAPGTRRMAERLQKITEQSNPRENLYLNRERADLFGKELKQVLAAPDSPDKGAKVLELDSKYATELLLSGKSWEAIQEFTMLDAFIKTSPVQFGTQTRSSLRHFLAIAYLRLGEQENCQRGVIVRRFDGRIRRDVVKIPQASGAKFPIRIGILRRARAGAAGGARPWVIHG